MKVMRKKGMRTLLIGALAVTALTFAGCGKGSQKETTQAAAVQETTKEAAPETEKETMPEKESEKETDASEAAGETEAASTVSGTISEIKDFQFTLEDKDGAFYQFVFEQGMPPKGLSDVKDGDLVSVSYTGKLSETDPFEGEVLSVTKQ